MLPTVYSMLFCMFAVSTPAVSGDTWRLEAQQRIEQIRKADVVVRLVDAAGNPLTGVPVRVAMVRHAFPWGTCVQVSRITGQSPDDDIYRAKLTELFNCATLENALKWNAWHGVYGPRFSREKTKTALEWLKEREFRIRGHCLVWPDWKYLLPWGESLRDDLPELSRRILNHIDEMADFTGPYVDEWDVVNEPAHHNEVIKALGDSSMATWFSHARALLPDSCRLFINDFNILNPLCFPQRMAYEKIITELLAANAPLEGIGFQGHFQDPPGSPVEALKVFDRFARFGLPIMVTEFDVNTKNEDRQAQFTEDLMTAAFSHPACSGFILWGFWEGAHWRPDAALFRKDWSEQPNLEVYRKLVLNTWWTDETGITNDNGEFSLRAFKGIHRISVDNHEQTVNIDGSTIVEITL